MNSLDHEDSLRSVLMIGGPQPISWSDVIASFENELGRQLPVRSVSPGEGAPSLPAVVIDLLTALDAYDSPLDMHELQAAYAVEPTPLADYVRAFLRSQSPQPTR